MHNYNDIAHQLDPVSWEFANKANPPFRSDNYFLAVKARRLVQTMEEMLKLQSRTGQWKHVTGHKYYHLLGQTIFHATQIRDHLRIEPEIKSELNRLLFLLSLNKRLDVPFPARYIRRFLKQFVALLEDYFSLYLSNIRIEDYYVSYRSANRLEFEKIILCNKYGNVIGENYQACLSKNGVYFTSGNNRELAEKLAVYCELGLPMDREGVTYDLYEKGYFSGHVRYNI